MFKLNLKSIQIKALNNLKETRIILTIAIMKLNANNYQIIIVLSILKKLLN